MGALRAAELHSFGMVGIGKVFEAYKNAIIEDDDEVAVTHGPEAMGCPILSEAMVNIRQTFRDAADEGIITGEEHDILVFAAKGLHYKSRNYSGISDVLPPDRKTQVMKWLSWGRRDVKMEDALELLHFIRRLHSAPSLPKEVRYKFQNTIMWTRLTQSLEAAE
jgi:hypothetical protein